MPALPSRVTADVLHVHVVDPVGEIADEQVRLHPLPEQVAGVEVEPERRPVVERAEQALGRVEVEGDLGRVHLEGEPDAACSSNSSKIGVQSRRISWNPASTISSVVGGKEYQACQIGEPMKPVTTRQPMRLAARAVAFISSTAHLRSASGLPLHLRRGEGRRGAVVVAVADALAGQVGAERPAAEPVLLENPALLCAT